jgi:hypothetical protein
MVVVWGAKMYLTLKLICLKKLRAFMSFLNLSYGISVFLRIKLTEGGKVCKVGSWMLSFGRDVSSWDHVDNGW